MPEYKVTFYPDNRQVKVEDGENLLRAAMIAEVHINASCGGDGTCGKCKVIIENGKVDIKSTGKLRRCRVRHSSISSTSIPT
ncbi:MAG: 2Fe-2S iron-sulfur cluster binding domain-containing protein [Planctomycetes bacterium]|nr:2Fe-2S iron-sulfur cluster binding domain-containing protein [Planctomycetota bacterium]